MNKRNIVKFLLCGLFIFLLLPAVFEEDSSPARKSAFDNATSFNPSEDIDAMPVLTGKSSKDSIFKKYGRKFKKMYGKAFFGIDGDESPRSYAQGESVGNSGEDLSLAMSYLLSDEEHKTGNVRASYEGDLYEDEGDNTVSALLYDRYVEMFGNDFAPMKQTMHDNAPVKGLYETSFIEPSESKLKANEVYRKVMSKFDQPVFVSSNAKGSAQNSNTLGLPLPGLNVFDTNNDPSQDGDGKSYFSRRYTGIAERTKANANGRKGGGLYAYGKGGRSSAGTYGSLQNFEGIASNVAGRVSAAATDMREDRTQAGTKSGGASSAGESGAEGVLPEGQGPSYVPGRDDLEPRETFNPNLYTEFVDEGCDIDLSLFDDEEPETPNNNAVNSQENKGAENGQPAVKEDDTVKPCDKGTPLSINTRTDINNINVIIDLGKANIRGRGPIRVSPKKDSNLLSYVGLSRAGLTDYVEGKPLKELEAKFGDNYVAMTDKEIDKLASDPNKVAIIITTDKAHFGNKYPGRVIDINGNDLQHISGLEKMVKELNKIDLDKARQNILDEQAYAKAQQKADIQGKQGEILDAGKYAAEE